MLVLSGMLKKIHDAAESVLTDMQSTVDIKERERASIKAAYSAYRSAFAILQGESEGRELYDGAVEYLNQDYARKLGEIEMFIDFSDGIIKATDLQTLAYDAKAMEKLEAWETRLNETVFGGGQSQSQGTSAAPLVRRQGDALDALLDASGSRRK